MRFLEVPALITEDIEVPDILDITEPITASISGTTLTIDGDSKVSGEVTITLTNDVTVSTVTTSNIRQPSIHKITIKTNGAGNFTYVPNAGVTASSVSTTTKTGSDLEILLITTSSGETYLDLDLADYVSPAANFSNVLTGFNVSDLTSAYGTTAKLYKPDGTLLTTVNSAATGSGVNFGYTETEPGDVIYKLEVTDDLGRKSKYNLPRKWINYAMETTSTPGFQKFALEGNEYTSTVTVPNLTSSSKARIHKTTDHGYMGIKFRIQGRNSPSDDWVDVDDTGENENADESAEFLAFGNYKYQRVWVKPTAKATTTVSSSNVVTLTLSNVTEDVTTKTITGTDPFHVDETSNVFVFEETAKIGTIPYTVNIGGETYTNAVTATTNEISIPTTPNTDFTAAGPNMLHLVGTSSQSSNYMAEASGDGKYIAFGTDNSGAFKIMKGDPETGYTDYATATFNSGAPLCSMSYDGKYIIGVGTGGSNNYYDMFKHDESAGTYTKLSTTYTKLPSLSTLKPAFVPRSGNYDFVLTGSESNGTLTLKLYKHTAGTDTWTGQTDIVNPTNKPTTNQDYGRFGASFTRDGNYLFLSSYGSYGGYSMFTIDWDANTAVFSGANRSAGDNIGHAGAVTPDGKYALLFHNDSNTRLIYKNNDAGDWSSATDVTSTFTFNNGDDDQGGGICFFGDHGQYYISRMGGSNVRIYKWLDVLNKEITLTYNGKDMLTLAHKGGLTTTSVKLYKDDILYHTFGASETSVVIAEAGVYQAIADEKYYSLKVTVTTVTETLARLYLNRFACFLIKKDGKVWYWGESNYGTNAMGNNTQVALPTLNDNLNALPSGIKQIGHCGTDAHASCAITNDGKLYTWGYNGHGQLGRGNTSDYTSQGPWLVSTQSSNTFTFCHSSYYNNYAIQDNGYVWVSGHGGHYINGLGNTSNITTFTRINLPNVIDIHANHNIALALTSDNEVYIWGTESNSSMGGVSGTTATPTHMTALDGKNIVKVRTGGYTGHAISSDGKMYSWGKGQYYAVPDGTNSNVGTPTEMTWFSRKNIKLVDAQFPYDEAAACLGLDDQGNMYVWGMSDHGAIGVYHHHPATHSWPVLLKTNIASISVGRHSCGCIDKFGQVYTWGDGLAGQQNWIHGSNSDTDINYPTSNNLSVGSSVVYDGFDKYLLGKDSTVTSNVTFGSNTVSLGTKSEVFISDPHTYKFKIMESGKTTYTSTVISSTPTRPTGRVYPPKSGTHKNVSTSGSANVDNTWTTDGALYGNGDYKASMDKNTNSSEHIYHAFSGVTGYGHMHTNNLGSTATAAIQLHMPQKIKLTKYAMYSRNFTGEYNYAPKTWKVYGSNDNGTNWTELDSQTDETVSSWGSQLDHRDTKREYTVTGNTKYFSSYKLDVTANGGGNFVVISQIEYYGDEDGFLSDDGFGKLTLDVKGDTSATSNIVFHSNTYVMGAARDLYITDTGEYTADIFGSNKHFLGSKTHTISTVDTVPGFTAAFHHGAFSASDYSSAYSSVADAATAGHVYSDTPAGDYTWGTLAHVKERENPDFTANSTLHTDYSSTYGWTTNSGWEVSAKDEFSSTYEVWNAFNKGDGAANNNWLSGSAPSTSSPQWLKIKYPSQQVIKSYVIKARDNDSIRFPTAWKLQGSNNDSDWTDIGSEQTQTAWLRNQNKSFDLSTNTTAYQYYRLRITGARESASSSNDDYVAIGQWFLNTVNGENTTNHDQYTRYSWTPASTITANVLRVAGGGGGGGVIAGGGGAGGLLYSENVSLSGEKSIVVGNGGNGGKGYNSYPNFGRNGYDTSFTGLTTSYGGGDGSGGAAQSTDGGGSGGGGSYNYSSGGLGTASQGNAGGNGSGSDGNYGGGGGGAGGGGGNGSSSTGGTGGIGLDYTSIFGTTYGDSGWFASGGGGGGRGGTGGTASNGGGTNGTGTSVACDDAQKHTGGGGGGAGYNNAQSTYLGGDGGSGIVLIKKLGPVNPPALNFDGYNKLTIDNVDLRGYVESPTDNDKLPRASAAEREIAAGNWTPHYDYIYEAQSSPTGFYRFKICNQSASTPSNPTSDTSNTHTNNRHSILYEISTGKWYDGSPNADPNYITTTSTYAAESVTTANPAQIWTWNGTTLNDSYVLSSLSWSQPPPDGSSTFTIKKDDAAFATTTSNTVYIRNAGTYTAEVKGLGAYVTEVSKVVSTINNAPDWRETQFQLLYSENPNQNDYFGVCVDIDGDYACIGSPYDDTNAGDKGAVYVFHKSNGVWTYQDILQPDSTSENFAVGKNALSIHGDTIAVGAQSNDTGGSDFGAVYVFRRNGTSWSKEAKLQSSDAQTSDNFGSGVGIYGDYIVAGAYAEDTGGSRAGSAYIFKRTDTTWQQKVKIQSGDQSVDDKFGVDCKIYGDYVIVSAPEEDVAGSEYGAAYIFKKNADESWTKTETLLASDGAYLDRIGFSVGIYDEYAIVGAQLKDNGGTNRGGAYIFKKNADESWTEQAILTSDDPIDNYSFGTSVYIKGNYAIVGEPGNDANTGSFMYVFERSGSSWTQVKKFQVTNGQNAKFGSSVAISGDTILSGAPYDDVKNVNAGACYVFSKTPPGPYATYDNYNKITLNQLNYADTSIVTYYSNTYNLGTAKTMYVKDIGDYVFKISGTDKYVDSNVYVSSVDLAGATTKPISFDGYNKLTLISPGTNAVSNVTLGATKYDMGSASTFYIKDTGTYDLEMSGSNVFALSSNVVGGITTTPDTNIAFHHDTFATSGDPYSDGSVTAAATAGHIFSDTTTGTYTWGTLDSVSTASNQTTYTWTPVSQLNNAKVLIVGAGGSGNSSGGSNGGGSGAGEIQFLQSTTITNSSKTVIVGNYITNSSGNSSTFDGTTAIGGGVGGAMESTGGSGGSGGGSGSADAGTVKNPGSATGTGYGNSGGSGYKGDDNNRSGGGGGGAGGVGGNAIGYEPGAGGIGMDFSSNFGTIYGEDGWFAGGGAGGPRSTPSPRWRKGGKGGGSGDSTTGNGLAHTGGGAQPGISGTGNGGSGIILIKFQTPSTSLTFDNYNKLTIENFTTTDKQWPPADGTWSISTDNSTTSEWTISGASYGNGSYKAASSVATNGIFRAYQAFEGTESGNTSSWQIMATAGILSIELPESVLINKYALLNRNYNLSEDQDASPKDFTFEGSSDGSTWVVLDTVTGNGYYTAEGTASQQTFTMSNTTAYKHYRLNVTTINGGSAMVVGELKLLVSNPRTATLTDPNGSTYALGQTQDTIYIKDTGNYTLDVQNNDQKAIVTKNVTGTLSANPGTPLMTSILVTRNNGSDYTEASPSTERNGAWESRFVVGNVGTVEMDGSSGSGVGFSMYLNFDQTFTVNTAVFKMISTYQTYKDVSFRCGTSESDYITVDPGGQNFASTQTITFTFSSPITVNKLYFAVVQDNGNDLYNIRMTNGDIIINGLAYPLAAGTAQLPSPVLNFDTYNKLTLTDTDSDATSNIDFFSNTYEMGSRKELIINDTGTYHANIYSSNTLALVKKQVTGTVGPQSTITPTYGGTQEIVSPNSGGVSETVVSTNASGPTQTDVDRLSNDILTIPNNITWSTSANLDDTKIFYTFPYWTKIDKWQIWDARRDWTFTEYHVWFGSSTTDLTKYATYSFNPTSQWDGGTPNNQTQTLSVGSEQACKVMAFSFTDPTTNPNNSNATIAGVGVNEIKIWGYQSATSASSLVLTFPKLDFDGYNKLTAPVLDASFTATRLSDWDNSNQSKTNNFGTGDWPETTAGMTNWWTLHNNDKVYDNLWRTTSSGGEPVRDPAQLFTTVTSSDWAYGSHTDYKSSGYGSSDSWNVGYKFTAGSKKVGSMKIWQACANHPMGDVTIKYWDGSSLKTVTNQSPSGFPSSISYYTEQEFTFDTVNAQYWMFETKAHASSPNNQYIGSAGWQLLSGRDPVTTVITNGSDSYDIGTASSIYIDAAGTYDAQAKNSNTFVIKASNVVSGSITRSQIWNANETQILYASDAQASDAFGYSVSINGDYSIVGARNEDTGGSNAGAAYIYVRSGTTWSQQQKLTASDAAAQDYFGVSVSLSGDYAIVGAYSEDTGGTSAGAAYIYTRDPSTGVWGSEQKIQASDKQANELFGYSVSISGDYAIVGARDEDTGGTDAGAAYIYTRDPSTGVWGSEQKIQASDKQSIDLFGYSVSISGDYAIVGTFLEDTGGTDAGAAYIYTRDPSTGVWGSEQKILSSDIEAGDRFGVSVSISGDYAIVGAQGEDVGGSDAGAAYIYTRDPSTGVWGSEQKLTASDREANDNFGNSVSISSDYAIVGARSEDTGGSDAGAAYIFERSGTNWTEVKKITASDAQASDSFGISVAIDGTTVFVGAHTEDTKVTDAGAAYVYEKTYVGPTLTYDNANKLSLTGVTTPSTNLTVGTNTYDIGSATNVYIKDQGTYKFHTNDGDQALIMNKTVSSDPSGGVPGELDTVVAFHQGTFSNSGDPYSHGSVAAAATAGYVYSDTAAGTYTWGTLVSGTDTAATGTPQGLNFVAAYTTYSWTPPNALTGARTLCVAGGGGGGADTGGGGGAGGYLEASDQSMSGTQTIIVGGGGDGIRRNYNDSCYYGGNGGDSSISGTSQTSIGGGGGGSRHDTNDSNHEARAGGSGGGASGRTGSVGGAGTAGQGYEGASSTTSHYCCGGGGASEAGTWGANSSTQADGGDGKSSDILGMVYWWSGGGGGAEHSNPKGSGGKGGGGVGAWGAGVSTVGGSPDTNGVSDAETTPGSDSNWHQRGGNAGKHTGGGGGGGSHHNAGGGGHGGSGMVVIKFSKGTKDAPSQVYDNTKTITVSNIPSGTSTVGKIYKGATVYTIHATEPTSNVIIKNTGSYVSVFTTSSSAYFTNTVNVNATPTTTSDDNTIEDEAESTVVEVSKTIAFHDGTFADSDDPHGDGSITAAATAGHVYSDTAPGTYTWGTLTSCVRTAMTDNNHSDEDFAYRHDNGNTPTAGFTTYKWTPPGAITNGRTLVVAGGGGGGTDMGGGGGAGGLLASTTTNIAHTEQTIQVGDGGARGYGPSNTNQHRGGNGADSSISGPGITAIGGGGGATGHNDTYDRAAGNGGSGGGGSGGLYSSGNYGAPNGTGTAGQGFDGGNSGQTWYPGGGGGAGEKGYGRNGSGGGGNTVKGNGGNGLEDDILGTNYWWAGGGGCNSYHSNYTADNRAGHGGKGGGGGGAPHGSSHGVSHGYGDTNGITNGKDGDTATSTNAVHNGGSGGKHTGGGGGGGDHNNQTNVLLMRGGRGGSGIVAIKFTAQVGSVGIPGSTAVPVETITDTPSATLVATDTTVADPILDLDFTTTLPRNLKRYNSITSSSIGARFNRTESKKKRVHKSINTDKFSIELTANNMGDSSSSTSTLPVTVVNSGAGTQYTSGWTTAGSTSSFVVPSDAPNALYYYSQNDDSAGGSISVSSASTTTHTVTVVSSSAGTQYTSGWTASGTPGSSGGINTFIAPSNAPNTLYYYCGNHSGMGGAINMVSGPVSTTFTVTVSSYYGSNYYYIDGTQQATISLVRGKTYTFNNNASGSHPMYFATSSDGTVYDSGVTNGGTSSVTFAVPLNAPSTLYYKCGVHGGMGGTIHILGPTASPLAVTVSGGKFVIGGVSQATLQLVRGETYVFNQENSTNSTHPLRLSETSNGTHVSGGSGFYIGGTQRPTLSMVRGNTYTFDQTNASNGSHVLQIATASDGTQYTSGYTTGTFVVPLSAPDTLYYKSSTTSGMGGLINVTGSSTSAFVVTFSGGKFSIGGLQQASLSVIRGLTYTFNQISGHVLSLSSTSDGTRNTGVNKYYISGVETPTLTFIRGSTYTFTQETSTNTNHPIRLSATSNGTHASGSQYTSGWTTTGTPGSSGASSQFVVPANAPNTLYYYCQHHSGMGGASSINVADSNSGIILTYGTHALVANSTVSGEYTIATNYDGTTSNLYVDGALISQTTPTIASGAKMIKIGEDYNGLIKNLKFWNYAKRFFIPVLISPKFSSATALASDYNSTYGWDTNSGWEVSASSILDANQPVFEAFNKIHTDDSWHSGNSNGNMASTPLLLTIKYPIAVTVFKYKLWAKARESNDNRWFPRIWKLQGSNDGSSWTDIGSEQQEDSWPYTVNVAHMKEYTVSNTTAYTRYRLQFTSGRYNNSNTNYDYHYVALAGWELYSQES